MERWGHRFWVLNPARYQLESKEGTGLMHLHAARLSAERGVEIDVDELFRRSPPHGGDYMRMWTRILVEGDEDLRDQPFVARRARLEALIARLDDPRIDISPLIPFATWDELTAARQNPGAAGAAGRLTT